MNIDINKHEVDIDNLKKQNVNDLLAIKELYRKFKEIEEKLTQIEYIDNQLANKLKKEYENLKKIILDENVQAKLTNDFETINTQLTNNIETVNSQLTNNIATINSHLTNDIKTINSQMVTNVQELNSKINEVASTGTTTETVQSKVEEMAEQGLIQAYTLGDKTIEPYKTTFIDDTAIYRRKKYSYISSSVNETQTSKTSPVFVTFTTNFGEDTLCYINFSFSHNSDRTDIRGRIIVRSYNSEDVMTSQNSSNNPYQITIPSGQQTIKLSLYAYSANANLSAFTYTLSDILISKYKENYYYLNKNIKVTSYDNEIEEINDNILNLKNTDVSFIHERIEDIEKKNDFAWKNFDKGKIILMADDGYASWSTMVTKAKALNFPFSFAVIPERIDSSYYSVDVTSDFPSGSYLRDVLDFTLSNGGEVLGHDNSYNDYVNNGQYDIVGEKLYNVKNDLYKLGYNVKGFVSPENKDLTLNCESYLRKYFRYGTSCNTVTTQYKISRTSMDSVSTENIKNRIDNAITNKKFIIIFLHRLDKTDSFGVSLSTKYDEILNYIKNKVDNNLADVTTLSNLYNTFGTTVLEKRLLALESK